MQNKYYKMEEITQQKLLDLIKGKDDLVQTFVKKTTSAIVVTEQNVEYLSKNVKLTANGEYAGLSLGKMDNASYPDEDNIYKNEEGKYQIGIGLIFQDNDGELDAYPNSEFQEHYIMIEGYSKLDSMLSIFNKGKTDKLQRVEMLSISDLDIAKSGTIEAP